MVSIKLLTVIGLAIAFVAGGGIEFTRKAVGEAKKLKEDIAPSTSKPETERIKNMTDEKDRDKTGGVNA